MIEKYKNFALHIRVILVLVPCLRNSHENQKIKPKSPSPCEILILSSGVRDVFTNKKYVLIISRKFLYCKYIATASLLLEEIFRRDRTQRVSTVSSLTFFASCWYFNNSYALVCRSVTVKYMTVKPSRCFVRWVCDDIYCVTICV